MWNFSYACAVGDYIRLLHRTNPEVNLRPYFDDLLTFLEDNPPPDIPFPLLDLVELSCEFSARIQVMDNPELVVGTPIKQPVVETTEPTGNAAEDLAQV